MKRFLENQDGATAIEYALIGGLIFLVIVSAVAAIGGPLQNIFNATAAGL